MQHWTALTYAALQGNVAIAKLLLDRGAHVEGGARLSEEKCTITPLQVIKFCSIYQPIFYFIHLFRIIKYQIHDKF